MTDRKQAATESDLSGSATLVALSTKLSGLDQDQHDLRGAVVALDRKFGESLAQLAKEFREGFGELRRDMAESRRTPWGVIFSGLSVLVAFLGIIGAMAYLPIKNDNARFDQQIERLREARERDLERALARVERDLERERARDAR
jgi:hypothetical protein